MTKRTADTKVDLQDEELLLNKGIAMELKKSDLKIVNMLDDQNKDEMNHDEEHKKRVEDLASRARKSSLVPKIIVTQAKPTPTVHSGMPDVVAEQIVLEAEKRQKIMDMWKGCGKTEYLIPGSPQFRRAKAKAQLLVREMKKDEEKLEQFASHYIKPSSAFDMEPLAAALEEIK